MNVDSPSSIDLSNPELYDHGIPHSVFADIRSRPELTWNEADPEGGDATGYWSVTRMADLMTVSRDHTTYSSEVGHIQIYDVDEDVRRSRASLIDLDPPLHTQLRRLVSAVFTPRYVQTYEAAIRERVGALLDEFVAHGGGDWVTAVAKPIPIGVICDIMGVPTADHALMIEMSDHLVAGTSGETLDPTAYGNTTPLRELPFNSPAAFGIYDYACRMRARLLAAPGDDLLSKLATIEIDGQQLSEVDYARFFQVMIFAGNETTRSAMAHMAHHMIMFPNEFTRLANDRSLLDGAVEEVVRYSSPILYFRRTATVDTELSGTRISAGDKVVMWYSAANFDPATFPDPMRFDIGRARFPANASYGGGGVHFCLGASLARMEIAILLSEMLDRGIVLHADGEPDYVRSNFVNGIEHFHVHVSQR
jgi:cytochrome P450